MLCGDRVVFARSPSVRLRLTDHEHADLLGGVAMLVGRCGPMVAALAGAIVIVTLLNSFPALTLGPFAQGATEPLF